MILLTITTVTLQASKPPTTNGASTSVMPTSVPLMVPGREEAKVREGELPLTLPAHLNATSTDGLLVAQATTLVLRLTVTTSVPTAMAVHPVVHVPRPKLLPALDVLPAVPASRAAGGVHAQPLAMEPTGP